MIDGLDDYLTAGPDERGRRDREPRPDRDPDDEHELWRDRRPGFPDPEPKDPNDAHPPA